MTREKAYRILGYYEYQKIDKAERETIILNAWGLQDEDENFHLLDKSLQHEMKNFNEPQHDIMEARYDRLVLLELEEGYSLFSNKKLKDELYKVIEKDFNITGKEPQLYECPCCGKRTLQMYAEYDICSNCMWEDDGITDIHKYSMVNHMTLEEGKLRYKNNGHV